MAEIALQYLQSAHNKIGHANRAWTGWVNALAPEYETAWKEHETALKTVAENVQQQAEQTWQVVSFLLVGFGVPWAGRLLGVAKRVVERTGVQNAITGFDGLTSSLVKDAVDKMTEEAKDSIKGSVLDALKNKATGSTHDSYQPAADSTISWKSRLLESIEFRGKDLEIAADEQVRNQHKWSVRGAKSYEYGIVHGCPYVVDQPSEPGDNERMRFRNQAELEMWKTWALAVSDEWWIDQIRSGGFDSVGPILQRLTTLGVPLYEIADRPNSPRSKYMIFRIEKFRRWIQKQRDRAKPLPQVCYPGGTHLLFPAIK